MSGRDSLSDVLVITPQGRDLRCRRTRVDKPSRCRDCGCAIAAGAAHIRQGIAKSRDEVRRYCPGCAVERGIALAWIG